MKPKPSKSKFLTVRLDPKTHKDFTMYCQDSKWGSVSYYIQTHISIVVQMWKPK